LSNELYSVKDNVVTADTLIHGECLEEMAKLPDASVDMVMCDLPYGTTQNKWDAVIPFEPLWAAYKRVCKPNAAIVLTAAQPFTSALVMSNVKQFKEHLVWHKNIASNFMNARVAHMKRHEDIVIFGGSRCLFIPQLSVGTPYIQRRSGGLDTGANYGKVGLKLRTDTINTGNRLPTTLLSVDRQVGSHPTQKPVALMEYLIKTYSHEGMTVLDNCMGSGTTGVACANLNRNFIGIEQDANYFQIATDRIHNARLEKSA
jgi:site-specific DNA-methyltransferase (adenine-specific)